MIDPSSLRLAETISLSCNRYSASDASVEVLLAEATPVATMIHVGMYLIDQEDSYFVGEMKGQVPCLRNRGREGRDGIRKGVKRLIYSSVFVRGDWVMLPEISLLLGD